MHLFSLRTCSQLQPVVLAALVLPAAAAVLAADRAERDEGRESFSAADIEFFEQKVRPILVKRCYECHSGSSKKLQGGLRLDSRQAVLTGGDTGPAIAPGKPTESLLVDAINYGEVYQMPPRSKLPAAEVTVLTRWVERGAPWPVEHVDPDGAAQVFDLAARKAAHWCWQPIQRPPLPPVQHAWWPSQELDYFILAKLEAHALTPAAPADKRTLIRRVYFDLIGLPPSPAEVAAFVEDTSPKAFTRIVDQLLESPHFGERWARHWMDLVRYAETFGHEFDYPIYHAAQYRDYLIRAFNADVPYDQFVTEQIAGDLLQPPRRHPSEGFNESIIGTGFWWLGEATHGPVDVKADEAGRIDNQLDVLSKTFFGLTVACARCHDHKFDAISTKDYYALSGFLQSSRRQHAPLDPGHRIGEGLQQLLSEHQQASRLLAETMNGIAADDQTEYFSRYLLAARRSLQVSASRVAERTPSVQLDVLRRWITALSSDALNEWDHPLHAWKKLASSGNDAQRTAAELRADLAAATEQAELTLAELPGLADFDDYAGWFVSGHAFGKRPTQLGDWDPATAANIALPGIAHSGLLASRLQGALRSPTFTLTHPHIYYRILGKNAKVRLVLDGYFMDEFNGLLFRGFSFDVETDGQFSWYRQAEDVSRYVGHRAYIEILDQGDGFVAVDKIRFSAGKSPPAIPSRLARQALAAVKTGSPGELAREYASICQSALQAWRDRTADSQQLALVHWLQANKLLPWPERASTELAAAKGRLQRLDQALPAPQRVLGMADGTGEDESIFVRGNHRTRGDVAPRAFLAALDDQPGRIETGSGRLELARKIVDPTNPLTARVLVNRVWHHLFGRGIVASVDNFGVLGERPTHPQLLDHLASQFVRDGWSVKTLMRTLALSRTYQMSSAKMAKSLQTDPNNVFLHSARVRRLQGEAIRDASLAISGRLNRALYGQSVPIHITPFMQGRGRPKKSGPLDGNGRRSIYTEVRRNFLSPMMLAFDTPIPFSTVGRRTLSNVPAQALILMNDTFIIEQARHWARRVLQEESSAEQRIRRMYQSAFAREPTKNESAAALAFLRRQGDELELSPEECQHNEQIWADLAHVLMNVKEFVFVH